MTDNSKKRRAHLHWANSDKPCFCNPEIYLDLDKLQATTETLAAIFGIENPNTLAIVSRDTGETVPLQSFEVDSSGWELQPDKHYDVQTTSSKNDKDVVPIHIIFPLFPGSTNDEKSDRIHALSLNFYGKIWNDSATPKAFRDKFYSRTSTAAIQAFRQYNWLLEVFGGPSLLEGQINTVLLPKVMAKHTSSRMTREHAVTWLQIMKASIQEEFPDDAPLRRALGVYWIHFFAIFSYDDDARREFRQLIGE